MSLRASLCAVLVIASTSGIIAEERGSSPAERGELAVRGQPAMNPPGWSARNFDELWRQWNLTERPADFDERLQNRYGLHKAPYDNGGLPMGLHYAEGVLGKGITNDCLLCHAGRVAGQTIIGLGNSSLDMQLMFDDIAAQSKFPIKAPVQFSNVRGTIDPVNPTTFLMTFRDYDLSLTGNEYGLEFTKDVSSDPPAWWLLKHKTTRNWTGTANVNWIRLDMVNLLTPLNPPERIKKHETTFADIHAFIMTVEAPKYPFEIDSALAEKGRGLFNENCARCHGTYGPRGKYPNKIVALDVIGTDPTLANAITNKNREAFNKTWFAQEKTVDGGVYQVSEVIGYQAPPLDGIWATAPYFHNASAPTVFHVLNSKERPKIFTRNYRSEVEDYDADRVGLKITVLEGPPDSALPNHERRRIYDTSQLGLSNSGHRFGDDFTVDERRSVIEYLKTL